MKDGYTLLTGEKNSTFFRLKVRPVETDGEAPAVEQLRDLLQIAPYLNWQHRPQITAANTRRQSWLVEVALHNETHLKDLILCLEEQNFSAKIKKI